MDGHYVPNLTIGPPVVKSLRARTDLYLDCHLMVSNPGDLARRVRRRGRRRLHRPRRAGRSAPAVRPHPRAGHAGRAHVRARDAVRRGRALPRRDRRAARDEREHRLRRTAVHPRRCSTRRAPRARDDRRARARRSRSRSTAASRSTPRRSRRRPASTSSSPGPRSSAIPIPRPRRASCVPRRRASAVDGSSVTACAGREGAHGLRRRDRGHPRRPFGRRARRGAAGRGFEVVERRVVADGVESVAAALRELTEGSPASSSPPEEPDSARAISRPKAPRAVIERPAPGLAEAIRAASNAGGRGFGMLSRGLPASRGRGARSSTARAVRAARARHSTSSARCSSTRSTCSPAVTPTDGTSGARVASDASERPTSSSRRAASQRVRPETSGATRA